MRAIKRKICKWLGIDGLSIRVNEIDTRTTKQIASLSSLSADINVCSQSMIILVSRINGGLVKIYNTDFSGYGELKEFMNFLEGNFGCRINVIDAPRGSERFRF